MSETKAVGDWPRPVSPPIVSPESKPFWEACKTGKLLYKHCGACGEPHYYPRTHCPFCYAAETEWREASGRGVIYAFTVVRRAPTGPYAIAYVELEEGPRMVTNIVRCDFDALRIGQAVRLVFQPCAGDTDAVAPMFEPA